MSLKELAIELNGRVQDGFTLDVLPMQNPESDEISVLQVIVEGFDELPIYLTSTDEQILCVTNLFETSEVKPDLINDLNATLLQLTVNVPLSSLGIIGDKYVMFGAMSVNTLIENVAQELVVQSENALEALEALEDFLV